MRSFRRSVCVAAKARFFVHVQGLVAVVERGRCRTVEVSLGRAEKAIKQNLYLASFTLVTGCSDRSRGLGCVAGRSRFAAQCEPALRAVDVAQLVEQSLLILKVIRIFFISTIIKQQTLW